jgi:hypothetical protein
MKLGFSSTTKSHDRWSYLSATVLAQGIDAAKGPVGTCGNNSDDIFGVDNGGCKWKIVLWCRYPPLRKLLRECQSSTSKESCKRDLRRRVWRGG